MESENFVKSVHEEHEGEYVGEKHVANREVLKKTFGMAFHIAGFAAFLFAITKIAGLATAGTIFGAAALPAVGAAVLGLACLFISNKISAHKEESHAPSVIVVREPGKALTPQHALGTTPTVELADDASAKKFATRVSRQNDRIQEILDKGKAQNTLEMLAAQQAASSEHGR